jgi:hypothetical protein
VTQLCGTEMPGTGALLHNKEPGYTFAGFEDRASQVIDFIWRREREGFEPESGAESDQQVTDSENNSVPDDSPKTL